MIRLANNFRSLAQVYQELKETLESGEADIEAKIILGNVLGITGSDLITKGGRVITANELRRIYEIRSVRNNKKIPLAYILEEAYFMDMKLFVNSDVLIPRPETEILVEKTLEEIKNRKIHQPTILDLGTGSGCIAIALKRALPAATVYASDISKAALGVAAINAKRYDVGIKFVFGDYLDPFLAGLYKSPVAVPVIKTKPPYFDVIVSNPPYISEKDYKNLQAEIFHEPKHALVGFPYEHIRKQAYGELIDGKRRNPALLRPGGFMAFEFGLGQTDKLKEIFPNSQIYKDCAGIDRVLITKAFKRSPSSM